MTVMRLRRVLCALSLTAAVHLLLLLPATTGSESDSCLEEVASDLTPDEFAVLDHVSFLQVDVSLVPNMNRENTTASNSDRAPSRHAQRQYLNMDALRASVRNGSRELQVVPSSTFKKSKGQTMASTKAHSKQPAELPPGNGKKIVSFCVYDDPSSQLDKYAEGAIQNAELMADLYPGWIARFHLDEANNKLLGDVLTDLGAEIVVVEDSMVKNRRSWRFLAYDDPDVDVMLVRDADSIINTREVAAVNEWLELGTDLHVMRDHPMHGVPILAGMWGVRSKFLHGSMLDTMLLWGQDNTYDDSKPKDSEFLISGVFNNAPTMTQHDSFFCEVYEGSISFPTRRVDDTFVGQIGRDSHRTFFQEILSKGGVPEKCRRHEDWVLG